MSKLIWCIPITFLVGVSAQVAAQSSQPRPQPKNLEQVDSIVPLPKPLINPSVEPQVTIKAQGDGKVEEYRIKGRLYKMRVVPAVGAAYWLVDNRGDGTFVRLDGGLTPNIAVPQWVLLEW